jgi:drug/metabolite transporter (DMT)-like permease
MNQTRIIGVVLLVVGAILLYLGYNASQSGIEQLGESLTGRYSDKTTWYLVAGAAAAVGGLLLAGFGRK